MKALLCKAYGPPESLVVEEIEDLKPKNGEVVIGVQAAGLNFPDTLIIQGKYQFQPEMPFSPGGEAAGKVIAVGDDVSDFAVGDRVVAGTSWGSFAEQVSCGVANVHKIPDAMSYIDAAASLMTFATSYHALFDRAALQSSETLLVMGAAGGVGSAAIQLGKLMGAKVIAAASSDEKLTYCQQIGADHLVNYNRQDLKQTVKDITQGRGVDVIFDPVGGDDAEQAFRAIARGGRHLVVGFASGEIPRLPWNLPLLKSASIVGVFWGGLFRNEPKHNQVNVAQLLTWLDQGQLKPHTHKTVPLEAVPKAMHELMAKEVMGKIVIAI